MWARISDTWRLDRCWSVIFLFQCQQVPYWCLMKILVPVSAVVQSFSFQHKPNNYLLKEALSPSNMFWRFLLRVPSYWGVPSLWISLSFLRQLFLFPRFCLCSLKVTSTSTSCGSLNGCWWPWIVWWKDGCLGGASAQKTGVSHNWKWWITSLLVCLKKKKKVPGRCSRSL